MKPHKTILFPGVFSLFILQALFQSCSSPKELPVVNAVDLEQYSGLWYDIAHLPQKFQAGCKCVTAEYTPSDKYVKVVNTCVNEDTDEVRDVEGKAFPVKNSSNAKLKVQFFWPFKGDYYIIALDEEYQMALVGAPNRDYLWILSRTSNPEKSKVDSYLTKARDLGFDVESMEFTDHSCQP